MANSTELSKFTSVSWWGVEPKSTPLGEEKPFTKDDYKDLDKFAPQQYVPLLFTITDPLTLLIPPSATQEEQKKEFEEFPSHLDFKVSVLTYLYQNRYWRPQLSAEEVQNINYMQVNYQGLARNQLKHMNAEYLFEVMFEMALYHFGYNFNLVPHDKFTDKTYDNTVQHITGFKDVNPDIPLEIPTKKEMRATLQAVEYLHYVDFFGNSSPTVIQGTKSILKNYNSYYQYKYHDQAPKKVLDERKKKADVIKTTISRIPDNVMTRYSTTGVAGGMLTGLAVDWYSHYLSGNLNPNDESWLVWQAYGNKPAPAVKKKDKK